jgi:hypothetical protein
MRPYRRVARLNLWTTPTMIAELEAERRLYAVRPSRNEVANQLLEEGLVFRRMHRSSPPRSRPKHTPFPISMD